MPQAPAPVGPGPILGTRKKRTTLYRGTETLQACDTPSWLLFIYLIDKINFWFYIGKTKPTSQITMTMKQDIIRTQIQS